MSQPPVSPWKLKPTILDNEDIAGTKVRINYVAEYLGDSAVVPAHFVLYSAKGTAIATAVHPIPLEKHAWKMGVIEIGHFYNLKLADT